MRVVLRRLEPIAFVAVVGAAYGVAAVVTAVWWGKGLALLVKDKLT